MTYAKVDHNIDFTLKDVNQKILAEVRRKSNKQLEIDTSIMNNGEMELCFSNHYSILSEKKVYVEVGVEYSKSYLRRMKWLEEEKLEKQRQEDQELDEKIKQIEQEKGEAALASLKNSTEFVNEEPNLVAKIEEKILKDRLIDKIDLIETQIKNTQKILNLLGASKNQDTNTLKGCIKRIDFWTAINTSLIGLTIMSRVVRIRNIFRGRLNDEYVRRASAWFC